MLHFLSDAILVRMRNFKYAIILSLGCFVMAQPALAHHPMGGQVPANVFEGFMSGVGHPVIGLDHLAFVVAIGLLAAVMRWGLSLPVGFVMASLFGTGIHLMSLDLPAPEFFIAASVLVFGVLLALRRQPHTLIVAGLAMLAGVFHGYAYGEAVVGADMVPLFAYLIGFTLVQMAISVGVYGVVRRLGATSEMPMLGLRFAGFTLSGFGAAFVASAVLG